MSNTQTEAGSHFADTEKDTIEEILEELEKTLALKLVQLTPEERQQFGSINPSNKRIIPEVYQYHASQPELCSPDVDWDTFEKVFQTRLFLDDVLVQLQDLMRGLQNAKILLDWKNYQAALVDYQYTQYKKNTGATAYESKQQELKQYFSRTKKSKE